MGMVPVGVFLNNRGKKKKVGGCKVCVQGSHNQFGAGSLRRQLSVLTSHPPPRATPFHERARGSGPDTPDGAEGGGKDF